MPSGTRVSIRRFREMAVWLHKVALADLLAQSRELKAEARNLRMMLQYLDRSYPMRGGPGPAADCSRGAWPSSEAGAAADGQPTAASETHSVTWAP